MADEREYWLPPYWEASELFLAMIIKIIMIILLITNKQTDGNRNAKQKTLTWTGREWCGGKSGTARRNQRKVRAGIEPWGASEIKLRTCTLKGGI